MTRVKCSVDTCHYWDRGNICTADSIAVKNNLAGDRDDDQKDSPNLEVGTLGQGTRQEARTSSDTACETFRPQGTKKF